MKVSLITAVRNESAGAPRLIRSIRSQSRAPDEWIVVDGGSTDRTAEVFERDADCTIIRDEGNIAQARNLAIEHSSGEIIAVIDGGCTADPMWLESLVDVIESGRADVAAGRTAPRILRPFDAAQWTLLDQFVHRASPRSPALSSRSLAFLRRAWEGRPYPEWLDHSEDTWLFEGWRRDGLRIQSVSDAVVEWSLRPGLGQWAAQHFRYMRGQGRARLFGLRQAVRLFFYAACTATAATGWPSRAAGAWGFYLALSLIRFPDAVRGRGLAFAAGALAWIPVLAASMDAAKISGYLRGLVEGRPS